MGKKITERSWVHIHGVSLKYNARLSPLVFTHVCTHHVHAGKVQEMPLCCIKSTKGKTTWWNQHWRTIQHCFDWLQWVKSLQLSVLVHYAQQNKRAGIDVCPSERCWMCLPADFHCTRDSFCRLLHTIINLVWPGPGLHPPQGATLSLVFTLSLILFLPFFISHPPSFFHFLWLVPLLNSPSLFSSLLPSLFLYLTSSLL